jgi:hypothetical protein
MEMTYIYKVQHLKNNIYQVVQKIAIQDIRNIEIIQGKMNNILFQGELQECESFINLKKQGCL